MSVTIGRPAVDYISIGSSSKPLPANSADQHRPVTRIRWIASYALCGGAGSVVVLAAMRVGGGPVHGLHSGDLMTAVSRPAAAALELPASVWLLARVGSGLVAFGHRPLSITWAGGWVSLPTSSLHPSPSERSARADQAAVTGATRDDLANNDLFSHKS
jgi:hypothetical protein